MLKSLFDFRGSTLKKIYKGIMLLGVVAAIVIAAFGIKEILDVKHMKEVLGLAKNAKLIAGDVMMYILMKYLVWSAAVLAAASVAFFVLRAKDRKAQAA
jgi:hypothetical protein